MYIYIYKCSVDIYLVCMIWLGLGGVLVVCEEKFLQGMSSLAL